jgi:RHS repeat-associated protein
LSVIHHSTSGTTFQVANLHGDVVGTTGADGTLTSANGTADEYGTPRDTATTGTRRYGWLGAKQRAADTPGGLTLMGVRLYNPTTGRFLSVDPIPGGNANPYEYCSGDPVNCTDLDGRWGKWKKWGKKAWGWSKRASMTGSRWLTNSRGERWSRGLAASRGALQARFAEAFSRLRMLAKVAGRKPVPLSLAASWAAVCRSSSSGASARRTPRLNGEPAASDGPASSTMRPAIGMGMPSAPRPRIFITGTGPGGGAGDAGREVALFIAYAALVVADLIFLAGQMNLVRTRVRVWASVLMVLIHGVVLVARPSSWEFAVFCGAMTSIALSNKWNSELENDEFAREEAGRPPLVKSRLKSWASILNPMYQFRYRHRMFRDELSRELLLKDSWSLPRWLPRWLR